MKGKKIYSKPVVVTEEINVGVFGYYGKESSGPFRVIRPAWLWGVCCRG